VVIAGRVGGAILPGHQRMLLLASLRADAIVGGRSGVFVDRDRNAARDGVHSRRDRALRNLQHGFLNGGGARGFCRAGSAWLTR